MKKIKALLLVLLPTTIIVACGGGSSSSHSNNNNLPNNYSCTDNKICGPTSSLSPQSFADQLNSTKQQTKLKSGFFPALNTTLGVVVAFYPAAAPVLSVTSALGAAVNLFLPKPPSQTALMMESINNLTIELNNLQNQVFNDQNIFYNYVTNTENIEVNQAYNLFNQNINYVAGNLSNTATTAYQYYIDSNLQNASGDNFNNNFPIATSVAISANQMGLLNGITNISNFANALDNLSNSVTCTNSNNGVTVYSYNSSTGCGNINQTSNVVTLYNYLQQELKTQLTTISLGQTNANNVTNLYNQYNNSIATIFQNSVTALQTAYNIEVNNNLLNYLAVINGASNNQVRPYNKIGSIIESGNGNYVCNGGCTAFYITTASPTTESTVYQVAFESAAVNLASTYAYRLNQLILTTMPYIVSDPLISGQILPTTQMSSDYISSTFTHQGKNYPILSPQTLYGYAQSAIKYTNLNNKQVLPTGSWSNNAIFYQFAGLYDYNACANNESASCAPFFPNESSAIYNGNQFSAYAVTNNTNQFSNGLVLTTPTTIANCYQPSSQSLSIWLSNNGANSFAYCNANANGIPTLDLGSEELNWTLNFDSMDVNFSDVSYFEAKKSGNGVNFSRVADKGSSSVNGLVLYSPDNNQVSLAINNYLNEYSSDGTGTLTYLTMSSLSDGFFCSATGNNASSASTAGLLVCTNGYTGISYELSFNGQGDSNWGMAWTVYNQ
ncbi:MAG: hypothetical protein RLZZ293_877 [Pseudomonadota bacterium]|jgi:hypothetical protein